jgi:hypothetical protein
VLSSGPVSEELKSSPIRGRSRLTRD